MGKVDSRVMVPRGKGKRLTLGSSKVDYVAVFLEHVHLFNCLDGLDIEFL